MHISEATSAEEALYNSPPSSQLKSLILSHVSLLGTHRTTKKITLEHGVENAEDSFPHKEKIKNQNQQKTPRKTGAGKQLSYHQFKRAQLF